MTRLRIAMIGCRGVPATYGGIERHVEEIGARLVERGHSVTVFSRPCYTGTDVIATHRGMHVIPVRSAGSKHLEAMTHSALSTLSAVRGRYDIHHFHALGPGMFSPLTRMGRGTAILTVHGLDFLRDKWSLLAQRLIRGAEWAGTTGAHSIVVVAPGLVAHYRDEYRKDARYIRNGVVRPDVGAVADTTDPYVLFVGRLTPEKGVEHLVRAFAQVARPDLRLVLVGGSSHTDGYVAELAALCRADSRVEARGYVYGEELAGLYAGARLFVQPSLLEGMPLTLLEAASFGVPLLASDIDVHTDVLGRPGPGRRLFRHGDVGDLVEKLAGALRADDAAERVAAGAFASRILADYSWDDVTDELETLYLEAVGRPRVRIPAQRAPSRSPAVASGSVPTVRRTRRTVSR